MEKYEEIGLPSTNKHGRIHRVRDKLTQKQYAMKLIEVPRSLIQKFGNGVIAYEPLFKLSSPHVVKYITCFWQENLMKLALITELYDGGDLKQVIEQHKRESKSIPENIVMKYMRQMLLGIAYLHENSIIHCNLHPESVLIDSAGNLKVAGLEASPYFGQCEAHENLTMGSADYARLEMLGEKNCSTATDIWSLGCIFHELCCLSPPYAECEAHTF